MIKKTISYQHLLLFLLAMAAISWYYGFATIFDYGPRSTHQWRQSDSATYALNYYQTGMHFFKPRMHFVHSDEGQVAAPGESTLLYYLTALLYCMFGPEEGWARLLNLSVFLAGLYCFSRCLLIISKDLFYSIGIAALFFASPLLAYYAFNFAPNAPAFGMVLVSASFLFYYYKSGKAKHFYLCMAFMALAGLIKITALIAFVAMVVIFLIEQSGMIKFRDNERLFRQGWKLLPVFLIPILCVGGWKWWADSYNLAHNSSYFTAHIKPIWNLDADMRNYIFGRIFYSWSWDYFHPLTHALIVLLSIWTLLTPRRQHKLWYASSWLLLLGSSAYGLLWFAQFNDHDYYAIDIFVYPACIFTAFLVYLQIHHPATLRSSWMKLAFAVFLLLNIHHAKSTLDARYAPNSKYMVNFNPSFYKVDQLHRFLEERGIRFPDKVISVPDMSPNNTLYYMNLTGWTELYINGAISGNEVKRFIGHGAKYMIINDKSYLEKEDLKAYLTKPMGVFDGSIYLFDLR